MNKYFFFFIILVFSLKTSFSQDKELPELPRISINVGSFIYHVIPKSQPNYTQFFNNDFVNFGYRISKNSYFSLGTTLNSYGDRMALIGFRHVWHRFNKSVFIEGYYAYAGEFFFPIFSHAGDQGIYKQFKDKTGIGFAPYIYHGVDVNLTSFLTLEVGFILPFIPIATLQIDLF